MIMIGSVRENNRAARAACFLVKFFYVVYQITTWNFHFWGSDDDASPQQQIFHSLPLYMKTIRAKQAKVHVAYFVRRDLHGIIAKHLS